MRSALIATLLLAGTRLALCSTFTVTTNADVGIGSLREAINQANSNPGPDEIHFSLASGNLTITPATLLPTITDPVHIDGSTQSGYTTSPLVELNGASVPGLYNDGLHITAGATTVTALVINRFSWSGIKLENGGGNVVRGCFLGIDPAATQRLGQYRNLWLLNSSGNRIGGTTSADRNVISGATGDGIRIEGSSGNLIQGNYLGTDASGTQVLFNQTHCIELMNSSNNVVGGLTAQERNVMGGGYACVAVYALASNISSGNQIIGNYLGVDATGMNVLPSSSDVISVHAGAGTVTGTVIGGTAPGAGNVICGAADAGLELVDAANSTVQGNMIGVAADGETLRPNGNAGIYLWGATNSLVGGNSIAARNIISGNTGSGIYFTDAATSNTIQGNYIGLSANGTILGNSRDGILVNAGSNNNLIGGTAAGEGNVIAGNGSHPTHTGVTVFTVGATNNGILGNAIYGNSGLGIDLANDGVTPNDAGDTDTGENNRQNYPVLTGAETDSITSTRVTGTLSGNASQTCRLEFFANASCDSSGHGEGEQFLGFLTVSTDPGGAAGFVATLPVVPVGSVITAIATDDANNTSEFSQCRPVTAQTSSVETWELY